jgi:hypothetical protein
MMVPRLRLVVYVCVATGGALSGCGQSGAEKRAERISAEAHTYLPAPAAATRSLSTLSTPAGFRQEARCGSAIQDSVCFSRPRSIPLSDQTVAEIIREAGARAEAGTVSCAPPRHYAKPHLWLAACTARARFSGGHLVFTLRSLVVATRTTEVPTTRSVAGVPAGSEIVVTDVGE